MKETISQKQPSLNQSVRKLVYRSAAFSLLLAMVIALVGLGLSAIVSYREESKNLKNEIRNRTAQYSADMVTAYTFGNLDGLSYQLQFVFSKLPIKCLQFRTENGKLLFEVKEKMCPSVLTRYPENPIRIESGGLYIGELFFIRNSDASFVKILERDFFIFPLLLLAILASFLPFFNSVQKYVLRPILSLSEDIIGGRLKIADFEGPSEIKLFRNRLASYQEDFRKHTRLRVLAEVSSQVAHDIRSPLAALSMAERDLGPLREDTRIMVRSAIERIKDIANSLLDRDALKHEEPKRVKFERSHVDVESHLVSELIESSITEKRMQYRGKAGIEIKAQIEPISQCLFAELNAVEFKRVLSNLLNNSVEALGERGNVTVKLNQSAGGGIQISIVDNGKGIPAEKIPRLGRRGETFGKSGGSGFGLYHAFTNVKLWGGHLGIDSRVDFGTEVRIDLPVAVVPKWFLAKIELEPNSILVVLDDDESIHRIWDKRICDAHLLSSGVEVVHFSTDIDFRFWREKNEELSRPKKFLMDYELLGCKETGLDLIESLGLASDSILVTSRFEDPKIRNRCESLGVPLIPKGFAGFTPIAVLKPRKLLDGVLIDDDALVRLTWESAASTHQKSLLVFASVRDFLENASAINLETPVFLDSDLGHGESGEIVAGQIWELGFRNISLATGFSPDQFGQSEWIKAVCGKEPPWVKGG